MKMWRRKVQRKQAIESESERDRERKKERKKQNEKENCYNILMCSTNGRKLFPVKKFLVLKINTNSKFIEKVDGVYKCNECKSNSFRRNIKHVSDWFIFLNCKLIDKKNSLKSEMSALLVSYDKCLYIYTMVDGNIFDQMGKSFFFWSLRTLI